jgi:membrane protein YqaA with SNARE-associated domain
MGAVGSVVGSLIPFWIGRKGGEPLLLKRISHARLEQLRDRYESWEFFFVFIPSMLPPPTPMKLIIFAAGAFEMRAVLFGAAIFIGRLLRFGLVAYLTFRYGRAFIDQIELLFTRHKTVISVAMLALLAVIILAVYRKLTSGKSLART